LLPFCFNVNSSLSAPQRIPNSRYREIEEAGHSLYFEEPARIQRCGVGVFEKNSGWWRRNTTERILDA